MPKTLKDYRRWSVLLSVPLVAAAGCFSPWFSRDEESRTTLSSRAQAIKGKLESQERPTIIAQIGSPGLLTQARLENIALVMQLHGTGGKVNFSQQRDRMLTIMRRSDADQPNTILDDKSTAMVVASMNVAPAARQGDVYDVAVKSSMHAIATSLEHGWLLKTSLVEMSRLGGEVKEGFELATAEGPLVTNQQITGSDEPQSQLEGVVVGGARLLKERQLGITINSDFADAITMSAVVPAINKRFTHFDGRKQNGVATPREDSYVEVALPPRYRLDPYHFINVVLQVSFNESPSQHSARLETLRRQLFEPTTARTAAWQLEAIGDEAIEILAGGLEHPNPEIRFYAAHALAYLDDTRAIAPLSALCMQEPAFRAMCLNGLAILDSYQAADALRELLHAADAETRYGAALALRHRDENDPQVTGQQFGDAGRILEVPTSGPPLVAVSLSKTPEVVLFGGSPQLSITTFQYVNPRIIVSADESGGLTVSHFRSGQEDLIVSTSSDLRSVLAAITEVGGRYGDWVSFVRQCHEKGSFAEPFAMNPVPLAGRKYQRRDLASASEPGEPFYERTEINESESQASQGPSSVWYNPLTWNK